MGKVIKTALLRKLEQQVNREEISYSRMVEILNETALQYVKEVVQASLEKASESAKTQERIDEKSGSYHWVTIVVDKESITNESNIVLL